jgi:hypothetical protein
VIKERSRFENILKNQDVYPSQIEPLDETWCRKKGD